MGLSGRKIKQRIPNDPRNLSWADDASRFGSSYLSKLGFDHTKKDATLGISGNGLSEHLKVHHKLDLLGIGAQHTKDPNGIAWKQNKDFENLLKRLNAGPEGVVEDESTAGIVVEGFHRPRADVEQAEEEEPSDKTEKKKKRKRDKEGEDDEARQERKKKKKEKKLLAESADTPAPTPVEPTPAPPVRHHGRAHRARFIASKRLAASSSTAVSEILGIASTSTSALDTPASTSTPMTPLTDEDDIHKLNVSSTSVADYFKEKMRLVAAGRNSIRAADGDVDREPEAKVGIGARRAALDDVDEPEDEGRVGLGGRSLGLGMMARMGISVPAEEVQVEVVEDVVEADKKHKRKDKKGKTDEDQEVPEESSRKKKKTRRKESDEISEAVEDIESSKKKKKRRKSSDE